MGWFNKQRLELDPAFEANFDKTVSFHQFLGIEGEVFKSTESRKTLYFQAADLGYFIKIHYGVGWREIFKNLFIGRLPVISAQNEYDAIHKLAELEIDSLELVGFGCRGLNPAKIQSFVITKALDHHISLATLSREWAIHPPDLKLKRQLINQVAHISKCLHNNGVNHRDFYLCHFLMEQSSLNYSRPKLHLIDLHRVQIRPSTPFRWKVKDLAALYFSSMDIGLTRTDRLRFIRAYSGKKSFHDNFTNNTNLWNRVEHKAKLLYKKHNRA